MLVNGTAGQSTDSSNAERPIVGELAALLGDDFGVGESESPEQDDQQAGAPPADGTQAPDGQTPTGQARSEGDADAGLAGAPPADAATTANPDAAGNDVDPLAGATPLTYTVNGQERTFDGIRILGEHGAIIDAAALPKVIQRLSERDNLYERSQAIYDRHQALEDQYNRLTQWSLGRDQNGQERVLTGADAIEARNVVAARALASMQVISSIFDPKTFSRYVDIVGDEQTGFAIVPNQAAIEALQTRIENAAIKAEQAARGRFASLRAETRPVPQLPGTAPAANQPGASSGESSQPQLSPELLAQSVKAAIQQVGAKGLTPDDEKALAAQLPRYIRPATPAERFQHGQSHVMDDAFGQVILDRAQLRQSAAQSATAAADAATKNSRTLAQALNGNRQRQAAPNRPAPNTQNAPQQSRADTSQQAWALAERLAAGQLGTGGQ